MPKRIQGIYAALATSNMQAAEQFYTVLFGRGPTDRPMDSLIQWRDVAAANIQIFDNAADAGSRRLTIVPDMEQARKSLNEFGISLIDESQGDYGRMPRLWILTAIASHSRNRHRDRSTARERHSATTPYRETT